MYKGMKNKTNKELKNLGSRGMGMGYLANNKERNAVWLSNNCELTTA